MKDLSQLEVLQQEMLEKLIVLSDEETLPLPPNAPIEKK